jgi:hypothetical protein
MTFDRCNLTSDHCNPETTHCSNATENGFLKADRCKPTPDHFLVATTHCFLSIAIVIVASLLVSAGCQQNAATAVNSTVNIDTFTR